VGQGLFDISEPWNEFRVPAFKYNMCVSTSHYHGARWLSCNMRASELIFPSVGAAIAVCLLLFTHTAAVAQENAVELENREVELENIRSRIRDVRSRINAAETDSETLLQEIQAAEQAAAEIAGQLPRIEAQIREKTARLEQLEEDKRQWDAKLKTRREQLAKQIRIAYQTGRHDVLKLLLNQEDPTMVGRMVTYHEYHNRAHARKIEAVKESLRRIGNLQASIREETAKLQSLQSTQTARLEEHRHHRQSRRKAMDELQAYIDKQDVRLQHLRNNEKELAALLDQVESEQFTHKAYAELPPFQSLKGKLAWPVQGRFLRRFGQARKGGKLRAHGVRIAAESGEDVRAVSAGRVVFADWFRTMGLLMIIDHGNGFMSLYGNNKRLLKKSGDMVATGEIIARVGDTGGRREAGLYFEIRRQGNPLNPSLWCRR